MNLFNFQLKQIAEKQGGKFDSLQGSKYPGLLFRVASFVLLFVIARQNQRNCEAATLRKTIFFGHLLTVFDKMCEIFSPQTLNTFRPVIGNL